MSLTLIVGIVLTGTGLALSMYAMFATYFLRDEVNAKLTLNERLDNLWPSVEALRKIAERGAIGPQHHRYRLYKRARIAVVLAPILGLLGGGILVTLLTRG